MSRRYNPRSSVRWADPDRYYDPNKWVPLPNNREAMRKAERREVTLGLIRFFAVIIIITLLYFFTP